MMAAKRAPVGQKDPRQSSFDGISYTYTSEIYRSAMRTALGEHSLPWPHSWTPVFAALSALGACLPRNDGVELRTLPSLPRPAAGRLASRAALICSGVLKSGSESLSRSFARETWRLCRFANLLSIREPQTFMSPSCEKIEYASEGKQNHRNAACHPESSPYRQLAPPVLLNPCAPNLLIDYRWVVC